MHDLEGQAAYHEMAIELAWLNQNRPLHPFSHLLGES